MLHSRLPYFASLIEKELGIVYSEMNHFQLQNRLEEIVKFLGLKDIDDLQSRTANGLSADAKQLLLDVSTNNETSFFRDHKVFKALQQDIFPGLFLLNPGGLRIWSAASSTGQEAYSLAMILKELGAASMGARIFGTDISARVVEKARSGRYTQLEVQRGLPITHLTRFFTKGVAPAGGDYWEVVPELRAMVDFRRFNLLDPFVGMGPFDLILCRNVLIYQRVELKVEIVKKIERALRPGGVLILGAGESLLGISDQFQQQQAQGIVFYRSKAAAQVTASRGA